MPIKPVQSAKQVAINIAKQTAREGNEFLKLAREQVSPTPEVKDNQNQKPPDKKEPEKQQDVAKLREHAQFMQVYRNELNEIRRERLFKELQERIASGEEIALQEYTNELSYEQREVLKAQMEAVAIRKEEAKRQEGGRSLPQIISKKGRGMLNMFKKRNEQHVEMRQPPSG